jgi:bifunctional ADP-heptose synthase (sugar kinase/adenylyltransferase)
MKDSQSNSHKSFENEKITYMYYTRMSITCVSGYFDPIHIGNIEYFKKSKKAKHSCKQMKE